MQEVVNEDHREATLKRYQGASAQLAKTFAGAMLENFRSRRECDGCFWAGAAMAFFALAANAVMCLLGSDESLIRQVLLPVLVFACAASALGGAWHMLLSWKTKSYVRAFARVHLALTFGYLREQVGGYMIGQDKEGTPFIACCACEKVSYHPTDIEEKYCGYCHKFLEYEVTLPDLPKDALYEKP